MLHKKEHHRFLLRIDDKGRRSRAAPAKLADRAERISFGQIETDRTSQSEAVRLRAAQASLRQKRQMIRHHQFDRFATEDLFALELSAVEKHLGKAQIIARRRKQTAAAAGKSTALLGIGAVGRNSHFAQ